MTSAGRFAAETRERAGRAPCLQLASDFQLAKCCERLPWQVAAAVAAPEQPQQL
jgi:hypothetical protein